MAIDLVSADYLPYMHTQTNLPSTTVTEIKYPKEVNQVTIGCETHKLYVYQSGAVDGQAVAAVDGGRMFIPAGNVIAIKVGRGATRAPALYVVADSGTPTINIMIEEY